MTVSTMDLLCSEVSHAHKQGERDRDRDLIGVVDKIEIMRK
jgi:hypothetical protein